MAATVLKIARTGAVFGGLRAGDGSRGRGHAHASGRHARGRAGYGAAGAQRRKGRRNAKKADAALDQCAELRIELVAELAKVQHPLAQEVLRRRYLNGESYAEICDALALVERRVYQLHRLGVNKVCEGGAHDLEKEVQ